MPQNSPELRAWPKYLPAIDGLGMEELYFQATDNPCSQSWCQDNRTNAAAIRAAGKLVLTIDYADQAANIASAYTQARGRLCAVRVEPGPEYHAGQPRLGSLIPGTRSSGW